MKKRLALVLSLAMIAVLAFTGCSKPAEPEAPAAGGETPAATEGFVFERKIELVCPWGSGGGADTTLRAFASALEKEIGVPVVVNNVEGGGGVQGSEYLQKQPADGYSYQIGTQSLLVVNLQKLMSFDWAAETVPVVKLVHDTNIIVAAKDAPFNNLKELVEYAKANPGTVKAGVLTITGVDALMVAQTFELAGVEIPLVAFNNGAELNAAILGGHISLAVAGPAETKGLIESGDMKGIVAGAENRLSILPDVETTTENGIDSLLGPMRGIFAKKGTPEEAIKAFSEAATKAAASQEFQDFLKNNALDQRPAFAPYDEFQGIWAEQVTTVQGLYDKYVAQ